MLDRKHAHILQKHVHKISYYVTCTDDSIPILLYINLSILCAYILQTCAYCIANICAHSKLFKSKIISIVNDNL